MNQGSIRFWRTAVLVAAGVCGAAGVALAAIAAHKVPSTGLGSASTMLLVHAAAAIVIVAAARGTRRPVLWLAVASIMIAGSALFAGDVSLNAISGARLFPMAAPTGGIAMIASWLGFALVALVDRG